MPDRIEIIAQVTFTEADLAAGHGPVSDRDRKTVEEIMTAAGFDALNNLGYSTTGD